MNTCTYQSFRRILFVHESTSNMIQSRCMYPTGWRLYVCITSLFPKVYKGLKSLFIFCVCISKSTNIRLCLSCKVRIRSCSAFVSSCCALDVCCKENINIGITIISINRMIKFNNGEGVFTHSSSCFGGISNLDVKMVLSCDAVAASIRLSSTWSRSALVWRYGFLAIHMVIGSSLKFVSDCLHKFCSSCF